MSGSGINWAICKSAPRSRQITTPASQRSVFYRPDALPAAQPTALKHWRHRLLITPHPKSASTAIGVASYGALGHVPPSTSSNFYASICSYKSMKAICHVKMFSGFCVPQLLKLVYFSFYWKKMKRVYLHRCVQNCSHSDQAPKNSSIFQALLLNKSRRALLSVLSRPIYVYVIT